MFEIVKLLVEHGADMEASDSEGLTPIQKAEQREHKRILKYLRNKKNILD